MGIDYPTDLVAGEYLGPPDYRRCAEAAAAFAATWKKLEQMAKHQWRLPPPPSE